MQHLTLAELESELAIRKATAAFEQELRKGKHVCIDVLFYLEREAGYTPEQAVETMLNYADAFGWGVGPCAEEEPVSVPVYYDGERYHRLPSGPGEENWTEERWRQYEQNGHKLSMSMTCDE